MGLTEDIGQIMAYRAFSDTDKGPPDSTNEAGVEFRCELGLTEYAQRKLGNGWIVWFVSGAVEPSYLLVKGNEPYKESQKYEDIACYVDMIKMAGE